MTGNNFERRAGLVAMGTVAALGLAGVTGCGEDAPAPLPTPEPVVTTPYVFESASPVNPIHVPGAEPVNRPGGKEAALAESISKSVSSTVGCLLKRDGTFSDPPGNSPSYIDFVKTVKTSDGKKVRVAGATDALLHTYTFSLTTSPGQKGRERTVEVTQQGADTDPTFANGNKLINPHTFAQDIQKPTNTGATTSVAAMSPKVNVELTQAEPANPTKWRLQNPHTQEITPMSFQAATNIYDVADQITRNVGNC